MTFKVFPIDNNRRRRVLEKQGIENRRTSFIHIVHKSEHGLHVRQEKTQEMSLFKERAENYEDDRFHDLHTHFHDLHTQRFFQDIRADVI